MSYNTFDPRQNIIDTIGTDWWDESQQEYKTINVLDNSNATVRIPLKKSELVSTESLSEMPFIEVKMVETLYDPHDVGSASRKEEAYLDLDLYFADTDNIDCAAFGKKVLDKLQNEFRAHECDFSNNYDMFVTITNIGQRRDDRESRQVIFHIIATVYCIRYNIGN